MSLLRLCLSDVVLARYVVVPVEEFIVAGAEAPRASVAELSGLLATMFLMGFQFPGIAEASYVANLHFLTAINSGRAARDRRIKGRDDAAARILSFALSSHSSRLLPRLNLLAAFGSSLGLHGSKPRGRGLR